MVVRITALRMEFQTILRSTNGHLKMAQSTPELDFELVILAG